MSITIDDRLPIEDMIEVTPDQLWALQQGQTISINGREIFLDDGPFRVVRDPAPTTRSSDSPVQGPLRRVVSRHGKHVGQKGVKGQRGGSAGGFKHEGAKNGKMKRIGRDTEPKDFRTAFNKAFKDNPFTHHVTHHSLEELEDMKTIVMNADGTAGLAVKDHGDGRIEATALFNEGAQKGTGLALLREAVEEHGVNYAEAFGPFLPKYYEGAGFETVETFPFDDDQAPEGWDFERFGRPDYHILRLKDGG